MKGGYDETLRRFGAGKLITAELIRHAFVTGLESFELLGSDEPYKLAWTGEVRELMRFQAFARIPSGAVDFAAFAYGRPVARRALNVVSRS